MSSAYYNQLPPKPRSAPGAGGRGRAESTPQQSRWMNSKTNALKEMEAWARGGRQGPDIARVAGTIQDNITEERLLQAKLWELSKERYKFISQTEYDKKVFLDRQQKKTSLMKDLLRGVTSVDRHGRRRLMSAPADAAGTRTDPEDGTKRVKKRPPSGPQPQQEQNVQKQQQEPPQQQERPYFRRSNGRRPFSQQHANRTEAPEKAYMTEVPQSRGSDHASRATSHPANGNTFPRLPHRVSFSIDTQPTAQAQTNRAHPGARISSSTSSSSSATLHGASKQVVWAGSFRKNNNKGLVRNPKYLKLENSLSETYSRPETSDGASTVPRLIAKIDSLHVAPAISRKDANKPKLDRKIQAFMKEMGITRP